MYLCFSIIIACYARIVIGFRLQPNCLSCLLMIMVRNIIFFLETSWLFFGHWWRQISYRTHYKAYHMLRCRGGRQPRSWLFALFILKATLSNIKLTFFLKVFSRTSYSHTILNSQDMKLFFGLFDKWLHKNQQWNIKGKVISIPFPASQRELEGPPELD